MEDELVEYFEHLPTAPPFGHPILEYFVHLPAETPFQAADTRIFEYLPAEPDTRIFRASPRRGPS
jgi:hypothetical protein